MDKSKTYSLFFTAVDSDQNKQTTIGSGSLLITSDMPTDIITALIQPKAIGKKKKKNIIKVGLAKIKKKEKKEGRKTKS